MSMGTLSFHRISQIEIESKETISHQWVKLTITDIKGSQSEFDLFFEHDHQREMFLEQIGQKVLA